MERLKQMGPKGYVKVISIILGIAGSILILFQNCAPERYFSAPKMNNSSTSSSSVGNSANRYFISVGEMKTTDAGKVAGWNILGRSMIVRDTQTGETTAYLHANGLTVATMVMAHVHDQPCSLGGGAHYKIDPSVTTAIESNEIWPMFTPAADGSGSGLAKVNHFARPEAQTVVIHDAANARIACGKANSSFGATTKAGLFNLLTNGTAVLPNLKGSASLTRDAANGQSIVRVSVNGLAPNQMYMGHVHSQTCANAEGGPHYKQNADVTEVTPSAANEMWIMLMANATGHADYKLIVPHVARADALAVVIHNPDAMVPAAQNRIACADLSIDGGFVGTEAGITRFPNIFGSAKLERLADGTTRTSVSLSGLTGVAAGSMLMAHVHDRPCHINGGGGHYKIDYSVATAVESNEIWMHLTADAAGAATGMTTVNHIARPEAYSVVVHDADNTRLACIDLY